jgi:predicted ATPase
MTDTLVRVLGPRHTLLILDNFEQLLPASAAVQQRLEACPDLKIMVTSRTPLLLSFEQQCLMPPMSVPDLGRPLARDEIEQTAAVALFKLHARAVFPEWELDAHELAVVTEICVRLDGFPLAIELAASWMGLLSSSAILGQLMRMLDLLVSPLQDRQPRHQTLRAAIRSSEDLLSLDLQNFVSTVGCLLGWVAAAAVCPDVETAQINCCSTLHDWPITT